MKEKIEKQNIKEIDELSMDTIDSSNIQKINKIDEIKKYIQKFEMKNDELFKLKIRLMDNKKQNEQKQLQSYETQKQEILDLNQQVKELKNKIFDEKDKNKQLNNQQQLQGQQYSKTQDFENKPFDNQYGNFDDDEPLQIISHSYYDIVMNTPHDERLFEIQWKPRKNGQIPLQSRYKGYIIKKYSKKFLLDYYITKAYFH